MTRSSNPNGLLKYFADRCCDLRHSARVELRNTSQAVQHVDRSVKFLSDRLSGGDDLYGIEHFTYTGHYSANRY